MGNPALRRVSFSTSRSSWPGSAAQQPYGAQPQYGYNPWQSGTKPYGRGTQTPPRIEVQISELSPYVQQSVLYTIRVLSSGNVRTLEPVLPVLDRVSVEKLGEPVSRRIKAGKRTEFVTEFRYALTAFRTGTVQLPVAEVKGTYDSSAGRAQSGRDFVLRAPADLTLEVQPANLAVQPWLPLAALDVEAKLSTPGGRKPGEPMGLTIAVVGAGLAGSQLPSLAAHLQGTDYKVYQEKAQTSTAVERGTIVGRRVERYTLVPQHGGVLRIGGADIAWWDVGSGTQRVTRLAEQVVRVAGDGSEWLNGERASELVIDYWQVIAGAVGAMIAYWLWYWMRVSGITARIGRGIRAAGRGVVLGVREAVTPVWHWLALGTRYRRLRHRVLFALPLSVKVRYCLRHIDCEDDPAEWAQLFQLFISRHMGLPVYTSVRELAERLIERNAVRKPQALRALVAQLDGTLYGSQSLDFGAWKGALYKLIRRRIIPLRLRHGSAARTRLPGLNPRPSA